MMKCLALPLGVNPLLGQKRHVTGVKKHCVQQYFRILCPIE
jgi:hypothetical protein